MKREVLGSLRRILAWVLCVVMLVSVTHMPALTVRAEEEGETVLTGSGGTQAASGSALTTGSESGKTEAATGGALSTGGTSGAGSTSGTSKKETKFEPEEIVIEIEPAQTTARPWGSFGFSEGTVDLIDGNAVDWIDRLDTSGDSAFIRDFYDTLVEASDNDGVNDYLIDDEYFVDSTGTPIDNRITAGTIKVPVESSAENPVTEQELMAQWSTVAGDALSTYSKFVTAGYDAFDRDHPEMFWFSGTTRNSAGYKTHYGSEEDGWTFEINLYFIVQMVTSTTDEETGTTTTTVSFNVREPKYNSQTAVKSAITEVNSNASSILAEVEGKSDFEKIRYFNEWLTINNAYNSSDDLDTIGHDCREVTSALEGIAGTEGPVCEAYARAFKLLCDRSSINCVLVDGYPETSPGVPLGGHMWNYVEVDGDWYAIDVTWNDPMVSGKVEVKESGYENEDWFLLGSETMTEYDMTYIATHPVENALRDDGVAFINGPELSETAYGVVEGAPCGLSIGNSSYTWVTTSTGSTTGCTTSGTAGSGTWSYADGVLTLNNVTGMEDIYWISGDLTIVLIGTNTVSDIVLSNFTGKEGTLTIQGPGSLEVASIGSESSAVLTVTIEDSRIVASSIQNNAAITDSIVTVGTVTTVYGEVTLTSALTIAGGETINFTSGSSITNLDELTVDANATIQVDGVTHTHNTINTTYTVLTGEGQKHTKTVACSGCPIGYKTETEETCTVSEATCVAGAKCQYCTTVYGQPDATKHSMDAGSGYCVHGCGLMMAAVSNDVTDGIVTIYWSEADIASAWNSICANGGTITLLKNVDLGATTLNAAVAQDVTFDTNGFTLSGSGAVISVSSGTAVLTITGNGGITSTGSGAISVSAGTVVLDGGLASGSSISATGGKVYCNVALPSGATATGNVYYPVTVTAANAEVTFTGGTSQYASKTYGLANGTTTFTVAAGTGYAVASVKQGSTALTADANGVYSFTMPAAASTITVEVECAHVSWTGGVCDDCRVQAQAKVENTYYAEFDDALSNWTSGTTLALMTDITYAATINVIAENLTLDLNGKTLDMSSVNNAVQVGASGASDAGLTITDNGENGTIKANINTVVVYGTLTVNDGYLQGRIYGMNGSMVTVTGGIVEIINSHAVYVCSDAVFEMTGGRLNGMIALYNGGTSTISGNATLVGTDYNINTGIGIYLVGTTTISDNPSISGTYDFFYGNGYAVFTTALTETYTVYANNTGCFARPDGTNITTLDAAKFTSVRDGYVVVSKNDGLYLLKTIADATVTLATTETEYTGTAITPSVSSVVLDGTTLTKDTDYTVSYSNNTTVGTATVTITGIGNYTGTAAKTFAITPATLTVTGATATGKVYDGTATVAISEVALSGVVTGDTVAVDVTNVTGTVGSANAADYTTVTLPALTLTGEDAGNYTLTQPTTAVACNVTISAKTVTAPTFSGLNEKYGHTGSAITPSFTLMDDTAEIPAGEYSVTYSNNTEIGIATITITDNTGGNYTVSGTKTFEIVEHAHEWSYTASGAVITATCSGTIGTCPVANRTATLTLVAPADTTYSGEDKAVSISGTIPDVTAPTVTYSGNRKDAGAFTASITVGGATASLSVTIAPKSLAGATVGSFADMVYTGAVQTPVATVTIDGLTATGSWSAVTNVADTTTFTASGNFTGTITNQTTGMRKATPVVTAPVAGNLTYNGEVQNLVTAGTATGGVLKYSTAENGTYGTTVPAASEAGNYTVWYKVEGTANYNDVAADSINVTIAPKVVTAPTFVGLDDYYLHTGSAITPSFTLEADDAEIPAAEYTVAYSNNVNLGTATITITDNTGGNYTVSGTKNFEIVVHNHVWNYTASGAVITATCSGTIGTCPVANNTVTVTLAAPTALTYDGAAKEATVTQSPANVLTLPIITYNTTDGYAPANAGTYTASITLGNVAASVSYTVNQAGFPANAVTLPWVTGMTYAHGTAQTVIGAVDLSAAPQGSAVSYSTSTDGSNWSAWGTTVPTMTNAGTLQVKVKISGNSNYADYVSSAQTITMAPYTLGSNGEAVSVTDVTYTGIAQTPAFTLSSAGTVPSGLEANLLAGRDCTVTYANNVNVTTDSSLATITITGKDNYTGTLTGTFAIKYLESNAVATAPTEWVKNATITAPAGFTISNSLTGTYGASFDVVESSADENGTVVTYYLKQDTTGYITAAKTVTVKVDSTAPVFDEASLAFTDITDTVAAFVWTVEDNRGIDGCRFYYATSRESMSSKQFYELGQDADGAFTMTGLAPNTTYYITIVAKDAVGNYEALQAFFTTKKAGFTTTVNKTYLYSKDKADSIDLAALLPTDRGETEFGAIDKKGDVVYITEPTLTNGVLSYTVKAGQISDSGQITVKVESAGYDVITINVIITLIDQKPVSLQDGSAVTAIGALTYGDALSELTLGTAVFVDEEGNVVDGTLSWKDATLVPNAGTPTATWVFKPTNEEYANLEGNVAITVNKAICVVSAVPVVADRAYHPTKALVNEDLTGGTVNVEGTWSWKEAGVVPTVGNNGYVVVFTPKDTTNYETMEMTITANVTKATPVIKTAPAAELTYGATLKDTELTGGEVQYGAEDATAVVGTFSWKNGEVKPVVADSGVTTYTVVFTPENTECYNAVEVKITVTVNKAQKAPNMPADIMNVSNSKETVGAVTLPRGWAWTETDGAKALEVEVPLQATAVYVGTDKGNYVTETVVITITRSACDHYDNTDDGICDNCGYVMQVYYSITVVSGIGGQGYVSYTRAPEGRVITVSHTADRGYEMNRWVSDEVSISDNGTFIMPAQDVTVMVIFVMGTHKPSVADPTPVPTATPTPTPSPAPTVSPAPAYNPETSWFVPGTYAAEEKLYDVMLGASKNTASLGSVLKVGAAMDLNFYGVKNWTKNAYEYKWTTSDDSIAVVDGNGNVTMLDAGIAIIRLELLHKATGTKLNVAPMEVGVPETEYDIFLGTSAKDIKLRREMEAGKKIDLNFYGVKNWKKDDYEYEWCSSDEEIASVDKSGVVTSLKTGKTVIRLKLKNKKTGEYLVVAPVVITVPEEKQ